jgi:general secretion pathway protein A
VYTAFYNLKEKPFNLTPSPRFLFMSEGHKEALALLRYGVMERRGFILLTGEVGTGKTTLVKALLESLDSDTQYVYISNPLMTPEDFTKYLAYSTFKEKIHFRSKGVFLMEFEKLLRKTLQDQKTFILIIDEAQDLSLELLEELRLLSNLEYADEKLVNIFLVGQPEVNEKLRAPECQVLAQRISQRYDIPPLDSEGTRLYLSTRLKTAGAKDERGIFSEEAIRALHRYSGGYPRKINILADNALLMGYGKGMRKIPGSVVEQVYRESLIGLAEKQTWGTDPASKIQETEKSPSRLLKWALAALLVLLFLFAGGTATGRELISHMAGYLSAMLGHP